MSLYNAMGIILRWKKNQLYAWNWHFKTFFQKNIWVPWRVFFEDLGVKMTLRHPAGLDYDGIHLLCVNFRLHWQANKHVQ